MLGLILGSVVTTGAALIIRLENGRTPVWSISQAEQKQRELNAERRPGECGRWLVNRHPEGEGRLQYDLGGCPPTYPLRADRRFIEQRNEILDATQSVADIYRQVEIVQGAVARVAALEAVRQRTRGTDAGIERMFKTLER